MEQQKNGTKEKHYSFCLFSGITTDSINPLIELIKNAEYGSKLDLYINSKGGIVPVAIGVFNFLKTIKGLDITTYNVGHCDSVATLLFLLGKNRYLLKTATFYMHSLQVKLVQPQTISSLTNELCNLKGDTKNFINLLSENSSLSQKEWKTLMNDKGTLIKAKKAIKIGIANSILENYKEKNICQE